MAVVDFRIPPIPADGQVYISRSVASLQPITSCAVYLMGWRFRRLITSQWTWTDPTSATNHGYGTVPPATDTRRIRWRTSPLAAYLHVTVVYQAANQASGGAQIQMNLYELGGGTLQAGPVIFDSTNGTLATSTERIYAIVEYPHLTAHTGIDVRDAADSRLGLVNVPSAARGVEVELRFTCNDARLRAATVWEWPTQSI